MDKDKVSVVREWSDSRCKTALLMLADGGHWEDVLRIMARADAMAGDANDSH